MHGIFGLLSSRGGRSLVGSFGERYGDAAMDDVGPTKNSSSIRNDGDPKPVSQTEGTASMPTSLLTSTTARSGVALEEKPSLRDGAMDGTNSNVPRIDRVQNI
jgi:hypothetical protein